MKKNSILLISFFIILISVIVFVSFSHPDKSNARSSHVLIDGRIYQVGENLIDIGKSAVFLFDENESKVLIGKNPLSQISNTEDVYGAYLYLLNSDGTEEKIFSIEPVREAIFAPDGINLYAVTESYTLYRIAIDGSSSQKITEHAQTVAISPDGALLTYKKLSKDFEVGDYFDKADGLVIYNIKYGSERLITKNWEDFAPIFTPDGKQIMFYSRSKEGLASLFVISVSGDTANQLTNIGQTSVTDKTVSTPSERPRFSPNGKKFAYESDGQIWVLTFDKTYTNVTSAKIIGNGKRPSWINDATLQTVDINGIKEFSL